MTTVSLEAASTEREDPPITSPAIHTSELSKIYGSTTALAGLSMTVRRGEIFGFLGPNGAGKTTAVKLLVGITRATGGEGWVLGAPIGDLATRRRIGYLPELFRYQDWLSAREVLALHCRLAGLPKSDHRAEIDHALSLVGIADRADDRVGTYSKGMQQRLGLGVALLGKPEVVFLDEPTSALDPVGRHDVREIIRSLRRDGVTVFLNSHLLSEVEQVCDRVAVVDRGRVIAIGTLDELRGASKRVEIRAEGIGPETLRSLARHGQVETEGDVVTVIGIDQEEVPAIVRDLVSRGCRIYEIKSRGDSLEESFLHLLGGGDRGHADHSSSDAA
ncbi:MAG TPA: ABC transporter ATP-binding protein [Chloroflexota bacterium]|nr:ABC transporter ATP-binding protein [Chloroflexota bacterium]